MRWYDGDMRWWLFEEYIQDVRLTQQYCYCTQALLTCLTKNLLRCKLKEV